MTQLLIKRFVADCDNVNKPAVRKAYGLLSGAVGICVNLLLCTMKLPHVMPVAMGANIGGVIVSAIACGVFIATIGLVK